MMGAAGAPAAGGSIAHAHHLTPAGIPLTSLVGHAINQPQAAAQQVFNVSVSNRSVTLY